MSNDSSNNKRIAQNTTFLYVRMLLIMAVTLYTSRVVLATLGVEDYGIYNVVGGVVTMFAFLNGTISGVTQRYITYELGTGNKEKLKAVFSTAMCIHWIIAAIILLLSESVGLWFVINKLVIPEHRIASAMWVYQFSVLSTIVFIVSVPYNACIIAHEKMNAFAYISIVEVVLKLLVVYLLRLNGFDKLTFYAFFMFAVQLLIRLIYNYYCKLKFEETKYKLSMDLSLARTMLGFTGWSLFGGFASVGMGQGINILLNIFFGPVVNAARAIAYQVDGAVQSFVSNFQIAMNPQIIKNYASGDLYSMHKLIFASCKYSFCLLLLLALPIFLEASMILDLWLTDVPEYTILFLRVTLLIALVNSLATPIMTAANATGNIKKYQFICGSVLLLIVPLSFLFLSIGFGPETVFYVYLFMSVLALFIRLYIVKPLISLSLRIFLSCVLIPIAKVFICSVLIPGVMYMYLPNDLQSECLVIVSSIVSVSVVAYCLGINSNERLLIKMYLSKILKKL